MHEIRLAYFVAVAFSIVSLFATAHAFSWNRADVRGTVTHISRANEGGGRKNVLGRVLVEGVKERDTQVDKASVTVTAETRVFMKQDKGRKPAAFADLKEGQEVEARFAGPMLESYPVQATAIEIIILRE